MVSPVRRPQPAKLRTGASPAGGVADRPTATRLTAGAEAESFLRNRVRARRAAWASAGASTEELTWLRDGYRLPWARERPRPFHQGVSCKGATPAQQQFLRTELQRLVDAGAVEAAPDDARYVTRAFLVPKPGRKDSWRLVIDLRWVNQHLRRQRCRYETLRRLSSLARDGDWMISLDLQDGFYAVGVHPEDRPYLTFQVEGFGPLQFAALPMGLSCSPYVFCKVMRTFVRALRSPLAPAAAAVSQPLRVHTGSAAAPPSQLPSARRALPAMRRLLAGAPRVPELGTLLPRFGRLMQLGLRVLPYMDDFLVLCDTREMALEAREYVDAVLALLGLSRNASKGVWEPCQVLQHLGLGVDTKRGMFFVTPERLEKLRTAGRRLLCRACSNGGQGLVPVRQLAGFTGLAQSLYLALPAARLFLRSLHEAVAAGAAGRARWNGVTRLCSAAKADLQWFVDLQARHNGRAIWRSPQTALLHCDASELAWGAVLNMQLPARGFWRAHQRREHITLLELRAVHYAVQAFLEQLQGRHVLLREDNQAVVAMLKSFTSRSPAIMRELRKLWWLLDVHNVTLLPRYIRSADNWYADYLSRAEESGDYRLNPAVFAHLQRLWGPCTIDRFASANNTQLPRFNSAWASPGSSGVDAFAQQDWERERSFCNPPWELLDRLAQHLRETGARAVVVAPHWPAQAWYQQLRSLSSEVLLLPPTPDLFCPGRLGSFEPIGPPRWPVACFHIGGSQ